MGSPLLEDTLNDSALTTSKSSVGSEFILEFKKLVSILKTYEIWLYIAWNDLKSRYRRTVLGPFWLVLTTFVTIMGMGLVWSFIFHLELTDYFPKLTAAMIAWIFISTTINEAGMTFTNQTSIIQNLPVSIYLHPLRMVSRNVISFLHNLSIYILVALFFKVKPTLYTLLFFPFFALVVFCLFSLTFIIGILGTRYRDFPPIITSSMTVIVFLTPVMWDMKMLGSHYLLAYINPLTHIIFLIKMPLLGQMPPLVCILFVTGLAIFNFIIMIHLSRKYAHRIAYWV